MILDADVARELDRLDRRVMSIEVIPMKIASVEVELSGIKEDIARLNRQFERRAEERKQEHKAAAQERKQDRRWLVGSVFMAAGLVISALAILVPILSSGSP